MKCEGEILREEERDKKKKVRQKRRKINEEEEKEIEKWLKSERGSDNIGVGVLGGVGGEEERPTAEADTILMKHYFLYLPFGCERLIEGVANEENSSPVINQRNILLSFNKAQVDHQRIVIEFIRVGHCHVNNQRHSHELKSHEVNQIIIIVVLIVNRDGKC